jgi:iron-sulfur cluster assembly accessory protein
MTAIHREMTIDEIFTTHPAKAERLAQVMSSAGLQCAGCSASTWETLEAGMFGHGMDEAQVESLIKQLNEVLAEEGPPPDTITITPRAAAKYLSILKEESKQGWGIRFQEKAGGCSGFEYLLDYSERPNPDDVVFVSQGIEIHVPKAIEERLIGSQIDYIDGLQGAGFKITNPNVRSSCGCGSSHGY